MPDPAPPPIATYRWQLTPTEGFDVAADAVPVLAALGISHLYLSPIAEAVPGSAHGYDVTDPTRVRDELGGAAGLARLVDACRAAGMAIVVDIVPNHLAAHPTNPWWWDVLRLGPASAHADRFDIDWGSSGTVLLPVLADHYGRELESGTLVLERGEAPGRLLVVRYHDRTLPVRPAAEGAILAEVARAAGDDVLGVAARLLARAEEHGIAHTDERDADVAVAERTVLARLEGPAEAALAAELDRINADADALDLVIGRQHYRLARWTVGDAELDYRRFFDVDTLVATRMQSPGTFEALHRLPADLVRRGDVAGLRVDHVDGLADPAGYLRRLRDLVGPDAWLLVEKILQGDEQLPDGWPVGGTTGYEVADLLGAWLTDPTGAEVLRAGWTERTGEERPYDAVAEEARREVLAAGFATDVERVVDALQVVCQERRRHRDHTRTALRSAVVELAVHLPVYRTYVTPSEGPADERDQALLDRAVQAARRTAPHLDHELFELLLDVLAGRYTGAAEALVVTRFQQLTGPVAAKGEEDTALYRWMPLPHRCEVGADPSVLALRADEWHAAAEAAQARWPRRLTTLSTHDTKRSADARARLAALTTEADAALAAFDTWWAALGQPGGLVDPGTAWLVFHALVAGWPMEAERAWTVVEKSVREAGLRTTWTEPDEPFETAVRDLVERAAVEDGPRRLVEEVVAGVAEAADVAALAQLLAQLLAPGVPDVYQGGEAWDRSLVDPDNRRPPAPDRRSRLLAAAATVDPADAWSDRERRASGLPRTVVLQQALAARRRHPEATGPGPAGAYAPLAAEGPDAHRVLAFGRGAPVALVAVVVRPGGGSDPVRADAEVALPEGEWTDRFTGTVHGGVVDVGKLLGRFPVALLER